MNALGLDTEQQLLLFELALQIGPDAGAALTAVLPFLDPPLADSMPLFTDLSYGSGPESKLNLPRSQGCLLVSASHDR